MVAPGLVAQRPGDRVKTDGRDARKLARLLAGGLLQAIHVPSRELEAARDLVRAREDARLDRMRDRHRLSKFCLRLGRTLPTSSWTATRRNWLSEQRFEFAAQQITFDGYLHTVDLVDARVEQLERAIRETAEQEPWRAPRCSAALPARDRHADRARARRRDRRLRTLQKRRGVDGLRRARPLRAFERRETPTGVDHQGRQQPRPSAARRVGLARTPPTEGRLRARPAANAAKTRSWSSAPGAANNGSTSAGSGWPAAANPSRRSSLPAPASSPASSGRSQPSSHCGAPDHHFDPASRP